MAVKGYAVIKSCQPQDDTTFGIVVDWCAVSDQGVYGQDMLISNISSESITIEATVKAAVKAIIVQNGITVGILDTIRLCGNVV